jgi:hypothetical protein
LWEDITSELVAQSSNLDWLDLHLSLKTFPISEVVHTIAASANDFDSWKKYTKLNNEVRGAAKPQEIYCQTMLLNKQYASAPDAPVNSWLRSWTKHLYIRSQSKLIESKGRTQEES